MSHQVSARRSEAPPKFNFVSIPDKPIVLGFSGKIGSGKTSCCNFLQALAMVHMLGITPWAQVNQDGLLEVQDRQDEKVIIDLENNPAQRERFASDVWWYIRKFSFAEPLKNFCTDVLGIEHKQIWGSQKDKNSLTHIYWEDMPTNNMNKSGRMTGREVMEEFGTGIVRRIENNAWARATGNLMQKSGTHFCIIDDVRFPNEIDVVHQLGGKVIRLMRVTEEGAANDHESNTALDDYKDWDSEIDNRDCVMEQCFSALVWQMIDWGLFVRSS
jgi:hypothetical protein